jgi:hypothetical protein
MMEQLLYLQNFGFFQSEWASILAFLVIGTLYFLAPAAGYVTSRRATLGTALWAMILKIGVGLLRQVLLSLQIVTGGNIPGMGLGRGQFGGGFFEAFGQNALLLLSLAETAIFLGAMILFVLGLQRLVRQEHIFPGAAK